MASLFARGARRLALRHIRRLSPVGPDGVSDRVAAVYRQMEAEFGMLAPPVALHAAAPDVLDAVWLILRETLLAGSPADRAAKEAVAAAVSLANSCPYCVEVHGAALMGTRADDDAGRIAAGRVDEVRDPALRALARWARDGGVPGSRPVPAPFPATQSATFIGVAVTFHYLNRMVNVFLGESPLDPMPAPGRLVGRRLAPVIFGHFARSGVTAGAAVSRLPRRGLPADLSWAAGVAGIADAMARGCAAIDAAGDLVVPDAVRDLVLDRLADPVEAGPGLSLRRWTDEALCDLTKEERPAGRLALLTAYASDRVTDVDIAEFRAGGHGDDALVRVTAWAGMAAARRVGRVLRDGLEGVTG